MLNFLFVLACWCVCAYAAYECVVWGNMKFKELDMSPRLSALIGFIFGIPGLVFLLLYAVIKVCLKRML